MTTTPVFNKPRPAPSKYAYASLFAGNARARRTPLASLSSFVALVPTCAAWAGTAHSIVLQVATAPAASVGPSVPRSHSQADTLHPLPRQLRQAPFPGYGKCTRQNLVQRGWEVLPHGTKRQPTAPCSVPNFRLRHTPNTGELEVPVNGSEARRRRHNGLTALLQRTTGNRVSVAAMRKRRAQLSSAARSQREGRQTCMLRERHP